MELSVRELEHKDIPLVSNYWTGASHDYLTGMGVDVYKMPTAEDFEKMLAAQLALPYSLKKAYALIWQADGKAIGHCNLNPSNYGDYAYMHLHLWDSSVRQRGMGSWLVQMSLPYFFRNMNLKTIYCQPYAKNDAPNRTLAKSGFIFVKEYITTPGSMSFEQSVRLWEIQRPENM